MRSNFEIVLRVGFMLPGPDIGSDVLEGMLKVDTLPNRKLAQDCWKALVPVGAPALVKPNDPCCAIGVLGLVVAVEGEAEAESVAALDPGQLVHEAVVPVVIVVRAIAG